MTQDMESTNLLNQINSLWGSDIQSFRHKFIAKTGKPYTRQAVYRWRITGIPRKYRRIIRQLIEERSQ